MLMSLDGYLCAGIKMPTWTDGNKVVVVKKRTHIFLTITPPVVDKELSH